MLSLLFVIFAAALSACMDKTDTKIAFNTSVFKHLKPEFYCKEVSANSIVFAHYTKYRVDFWHLCKSAMIWCYTIGIVAYNPIICPITDFAIFGIINILTFNIFYNHILKSST